MIITRIVAHVLPVSVHARGEILEPFFNSLLQEYQHDDLRKFHAVDSRIRANNMSDDRVELMRRVRRFQQQNEELQTGYALEQAAREQAQRKLLAEQDDALVAAMAEMKTRSVADEAINRRICDQSEELQELKAKLKAAELNKMRSTQKAERDLLKQQEQARERAMDAEMEAVRQAAAEAQFAENQRRYDNHIVDRDILREQMLEKQRLKQEAYEQFLKEKAVVDEIVRSIEAEDTARAEQARAKQRELQETIRQYLAERDSWREAEKKRNLEELRRIREYQELQQKRYDEMMSQKKAKFDVQDSIMQQLARDMEAKRREAEEMEQILFELYQEEAEAKAAEAVKQREEQRRKIKKDMFLANEEQKALKVQRAAEQKKEEEQFRTAMMKKFEDDARLDQMNALKRRQAMADYRKEVERMVEERRGLYAAAVQAELEAKKKLDDEEAFKKQIVERERQRLLREHAAALKEHLPKGVFRHDADYELVHGKKPTGAGAGAGAGAGGAGASAGSESARGLPSGGPAGVSFGGFGGFSKQEEGKRSYGMKGASHLGSVSRY